MTEMSAGGSQHPQHRGQSGQPSPAPETRTSPPTRISSNVAINVELLKPGNGLKSTLYSLCFLELRFFLKMPLVLVRPIVLFVLSF